MLPAAVAVMALILLGGGAVDMALAESKKARLQGLADNAALSAAREFALVSGDATRIEAVAAAYVAANTEIAGTIAKPNVDPRNYEVTVEVSAPVQAYFPGLMANVEVLTASATAQLSGEAGNVCVIGLATSEAETVYLDSNATLTAPDCAIYSNSSHRRGLVSDSNARLLGEGIYSGGGADGGRSNFSPAPLTDAPPIGDPLAGRSKPPIGPCDFSNHEVKDVTTTIGPGVYCSGLTIDGNADVHLSPGVYIIKDGPFRIDSNAEVKGAGVGMFLTGSDAWFEFSSNAHVTLSAPETGPLAGLLFFEDPANAPGAVHRITSNYARYLVGTVYLPLGKLWIDADTPVADASEYTVIVAHKVELNSSPNLVLNTDYDLTTVPVPEGVGPVGDVEVRLLR